MAQLLPPVPKEPIEPDSRIWREWFNKVRNVIVGTAQGVISWASLNFDGSNITDIVTRNHNDLQTIQGGTANQYYHLTATQLTNLGTVTTVSVATSNGFAGTVATATSTPVITLKTSVTGLLKGNGTAISAATSGTDYAPATSGTSILYGNGSGGFSNVTIGTGVSFTTGTLSATGSGGTITSVTGTAPVASSGGTTPVISMAAATTSVNGYLTSTDWTTFNNKGSGTVTSVSGTAGRVSSTGGTTPVIDLVSGIASAGTTGSASLIPVVTIDTYGRVTSITTAANPQGTVTSVGWTGGIVSVATATTTPAFTVAGTSGGVPYFSSTSTWATSAALVASAIVIGGGAGAAPSTTTTGTGVVTALGVNTGSAGAFVVNGGALGTPSSGTVTNLTGTASININGTVGATTANTGAFTTVTATGTGTFNKALLYTPAFDGNGAAFRNSALADTTNNVGLFQNASGSVTVNAPSGQTVSISNALGTIASITSSGVVVTGTGSFTGNVGIGTASPGSKLHIAESAAAATGPILFLHNTAATQAGAVGNLARITFGLDNGATAPGGNAYILAQEDGFSSYGSSIQFGVSNGSSGPAESMQILSNGNLKLQKNMSVGGATVTTSGAGITFPATQSASSDANTLDDYEEGTWTPVLTPSTSGTITITSPTNSMVYTKVGRVVTISGNIAISSVSAPIGDLRLTGLPFSAGSLTSGGIFIYGLGITSTVTAYQIAIDTVLPTTVLIRGFFNGGQVATVANNAQASGGFILTVQYTV